MNAISEDPSNRDTATLTRVKGWRLILLWKIWIVTALLVGFATFAAVRQFIHEYLYGGPLTEKITGNGLSPSVFFPLEFLTGGIQLIVWCVAPSVIAFRRRQDWMVIIWSLMSFVLGYFSTGFTGVVFPGHIPPQLVYLDNLHWLLLTIQWISVLIFLGTFPDGQFVPRWIMPVFALFALYITVEDVIIIIDPKIDDVSNFSLFIRAIVMPVLLVFAQLYRRGKMDAIRRQQTKFALAGFILGNVGYIIQMWTLENQTLFPLSGL